ncbi:MAG: energy-coupling factor transporter transmembrane component T [Clostridium sp.]|uniref:energy-coupling factor transporter transmembrane component T n=1 Tax=Clostridium sp. TaxID=1506 RepID=UPI003D6CDFF1
MFEFLSIKSDSNGLKLDPRTKLLLLLTIAVFVVGGAGGGIITYALPLLSVIPLLLLLLARRFKIATIYLIIYVTSFSAQIFLLPMLSGILSFIVLAVCGILTRFLPSIMMGMFVVSTTTVSEFIAAMERMHITDKIVIPMAVMFRFFPTVGEEAAAINDAMSMRGIRFGGGNLLAMLEYRLIPLMICSVKIGEELSAAALTRGLGAPVKRTNICKIGFHIQDFIVIGLCASAFLWYILYTFML